MSSDRIVRHGLIVLVALIVPTILLSGAPVSSIGLIADPSTRALSRDAVPPGLPVMLTADWSRIETERGFYDWSEIEPRLDELHRAGYAVTLSLAGSNPLYLPDGGPPTPLGGESFQGWLGFMRSAARNFAGRVRAIQVWDRVGPGSPLEPQAYGFLLKNSSVVLRAEADAVSVGLDVAQATLAPGGLDWQTRLWQQDVAAYVDRLPVAVSPRPPAEAVAGIRALVAATVQHPPAATVWAMIESDRSGGWQDAATGIEVLSAGASAALIALPEDAQAAAARVDWVVGTQRLLSDGYAPTPGTPPTFEDERGQASATGRFLGRFVSDKDLSTAIFYSLPGEPEPFGDAWMVVSSAFLREAGVIDPISGDRRRVGARNALDGRGRALRLSAAPHPLVLRFESVAQSSGFDVPLEAVETRGVRELTAEEIIARHQQVQAEQDARLERWTARGRADLHFKLAQGGGTIDLSIESNYFWERGQPLEWEQTDYYLNGNRIGWKKIPELPLIQPEKVVTLPLDLHLDRTYVYRRAGEGRVGGRRAYVLQFEPVKSDDPTSLYRGKVWIDAESFVRLRYSVVQTSLESAVISNEETDDFAEVTGPAGSRYWMLSEIDGQQIWKAAGRNFIVRREIRFDSFQINPPADEFRERRQAAYASTNQMLRDTDEGMRYLERAEDGTRTIKTDVDTSQLFAAAGAFEDGSSDGIRPLGGVNYFNYEVGGRDLQLNAFFAGVIGFFTASDPSLFGTRFDATVDGTALAIKLDDEVFRGKQEIVEERIESRPQNLAVKFGVPLGDFVKLNLSGAVAFRRYFDDTEAKNRRAELSAGVPEDLEFVLPENHQEYTGRLELEFNRRGYTVQSLGAWSRRSGWSPWGLRDRISGSFGRIDGTTFVAGDPAPTESSFAKWRLTGFKEWYLPRFQKIRGEVNFLDGSRLDRFSRYQFSLFGDGRLNGFSGSGVRFDRGLILRTGYSFNLFEAIRFDAVVETARVEERGSADGRLSFTGLGLAGNVVGPWKTVISMSYGRALASDIAELEGENEFLLIILKLF